MNNVFPMMPPAGKGPRKNILADYGAGVLPACPDSYRGWRQARATSLPRSRRRRDKERATKPAGKRTSQNLLSCFCAVPKPEQKLADFGVPRLLSASGTVPQPRICTKPLDLLEFNFRNLSKG